MKTQVHSNSGREKVSWGEWDREETITITIEIKTNKQTPVTPIDKTPKDIFEQTIDLLDVFI